MTAAPAAPTASPNLGNAFAAGATRQGSVATPRTISAADSAPNGADATGSDDDGFFAGMDALGDDAALDKAPEAKKEPKPEAKQTKEPAEKETKQPEDKANAKTADKEAEKTETDAEDDDDDFLNPTAKTAKPKDKEKAPSKDAEEETIAAEKKTSGIENLRKEYEARKGEVSTLAKTVEAKDKEISELREKLAAKDYTESPEYIEKYDKPLRAAVNYAFKELQSFKVLDEAGNSRPADYNSDFAPLLNANLQREQVVRMAQDRFGDLAPEVLAMRRDIMQAHARKLEGGNEFKSRSEQIRAEQQERQIKQRESMRSKFSEFREEMKADQRYKSIFNPGEDARLKKLLDDGEALVKRAFEPDVANTPVEQILRDQAAAANRVAAAGVLQRKVKQLEQEIAVLKKYRASTPGMGDGVGGGADADKDPIDALDAYADR